MNAKQIIFASAAAVAALAGIAAPASAAFGTFRAEAHSTRSIALDVRNTTTVVVRGDTDTDLDFVIVNSRGQIVHQDNDYTDWTAARLSPGSYTLRVSNLGNVYNAFTVSLPD